MRKGIILMPYVSGKGGTETVVHNLFLSFKNEKKIKLKLILIGGTTNINWLKGIDYEETIISKFLKLNESKLIRNAYYACVLVPEIIKIIQKEDPDFLISTNPVIWTLVKKIAKIFQKKIPVIAWYHFSLKERPIKSMLLYSADYYLAISSGIRDQLIDKGIEPNKIFLIYNPVDSDNNIILRPQDHVKFIYIGRLMLQGQKNLKELFNALSKVHGNWSLDLYGDTQISKERAEIKKYVSKNKIDKKINWKGFVKDPWDEIQNATALILTSKYEGLPMVLCEAISHGLFCVSSDIETGPVDIINKKNGKLYQSGNVSQLTNILQEIVDQPKALPSQVKIIETSEKFTLDQYKNNFMTVIFKILGEVSK